jgi:hypothetical protein
LANVLQGIGSNPYLAQQIGGNTLQNYGGAGGGITSSGMLAPTYTDVYGGGQIPLGYANL